MAEQRKTKRFELRLPVELIRTGNEILSQVGETKNMSSSGVLFSSESEMHVGEPIEYLVTLPSSGSGSQVRIRCMGKVMRSESPHADQALPERRPYAVAATLERYEFVRSK